MTQLPPDDDRGYGGGMQSNEHLVNVSGREDLSVSDRIGLLRAALWHSPFNGITESTVAATQSIHDLKLTICDIRGILELCERAYARGETDVTLARGAHLVLSPIECLVLGRRPARHHAQERWSRRHRICAVVEDPWADTPS